MLHEKVKCKPLNTICDFTYESCLLWMKKYLSIFSSVDIVSIDSVVTMEMLRLGDYCMYYDKATTLSKCVEDFKMKLGLKTAQNLSLFGSFPPRCTYALKCYDILFTFQIWIYDRGYVPSTMNVNDIR